MYRYTKYFFKFDYNDYIVRIENDQKIPSKLIRNDFVNCQWM